MILQERQVFLEYHKIDKNFNKRYDTPRARTFLEYHKIE